MTFPARRALGRAVVVPAVAALLGLALAACADDDPVARATPTPGPASCDAAALPEALRCATFVSVSGTDAGQGVPWLADDPLTVTFDVVSDDVATGTRMAVATPCNTVGVPVTIDGSRLVPQTDAITATLIGCPDEKGERERWTTDRLLSHPMDFTVDADRLTLSTGDVSVVLERSQRPTSAPGGGVERRP